MQPEFSPILLFFPCGHGIIVANEILIPEEPMKKALRPILCVLLALLFTVLGYAAYVFLAWHRIGSGPLTAEPASGVPIRVEAGGEYSLLSWNIGFGAYEADFGFFMDGGTESRARSQEGLLKNLGSIAALLAREDADFVLLQEVDIGSTRTFHVDERTVLLSPAGLAPEKYSRVFAQNYDSPYLFYPITKPHGASKSGLFTLTKAVLSSAARVELPVESGFMKLLDLDRCYSVGRIPIKEGGCLVLYNLHLSAYTSDGVIATEQLKLLLSDMQAEYEAGNFCIAGGDFNKDLLGDSSRYWGKPDREYTWAKPLPEGIFDGYAVSLVAPLSEEAPVPSCRNADSAYHPGQYVLTVDGFLVTDNVRVTEARVIDTGFAFSDHNPVSLRFVFD